MEDPKVKIYFIWVCYRGHFVSVNIKIDSYYQEKIYRNLFAIAHKLLLKNFLIVIDWIVVIGCIILFSFLNLFFINRISPLSVINCVVDMFLVISSTF